MTVEQSLRQIERCRYPSGLYSAVPADSDVIIDIYRSVWIRDSIYTLLAFDALGDVDTLRAGVHALVDRGLLRWSYRLDWRIVEGVPQTDIEYLHPRYDAEGSEIYSELWGCARTTVSALQSGPCAAGSSATASSAMTTSTFTSYRS